MPISNAEPADAIARLKEAQSRLDASLRARGRTPSAEIDWPPESRETDYRAAVANARASLDILNAPFATRTVMLEQPVWSHLYQRDGSPLQVDLHHEAGNSWVKLKHSSNRLSVHDFIYLYFYWANDTGRTALVDAYVPFVLTGHMHARAAGTLFGGDVTHTHLNTQVRIWRDRGWGSDDGTFLPFTLAQVQDKYIHLNSQGRSLYRSGQNVTQRFSYQPFSSIWYSALVPNQASLFVDFIIRPFCIPAPAGALDTLTAMEFWEGDHAIRVPYTLLTVIT